MSAMNRITHKRHWNLPKVICRATLSWPFIPSDLEPVSMAYRDPPGLRYFENPDFANNNILVSLLCAEEAMQGPVICGYSDILFEQRVVEQLLDAPHDISIVVDVDWREYYVGRIQHPIEEAESVIFDDQLRVTQIGKILPGKAKDEVNGEFIGMLKLSRDGADVFKRHYHRVAETHWDKPFQRAPVMRKAYVTDMLQELVDQGVTVHCVTIERGWKEIDTVEDYQKALQDFAG